MLRSQPAAIHWWSGAWRRSCRPWDPIPTRPLTPSPASPARLGDLRDPPRHPTQIPSHPRGSLDHFGSFAYPPARAESEPKERLDFLSLPARRAEIPLPLVRPDRYGTGCPALKLGVSSPEDRYATARAVEPPIPNQKHVPVFDR